MDFWSRFEETRARWNVLEHPFYQRWANGQLTRDELAVYAGEYRHAVVGLARASANAAALAGADERPGLEHHAVEEASHIDLWDGFMEAVGTEPRDEPAPESVACGEAWAGDGRDLLETLVAMYTIESSQPAISETKAAGLRSFYGIGDGPGIAYFALHAELDKEHAASARALIEPRLDGADVDALIGEAEAVLRANWALLDGVERLVAQ